MCLIILAHQYHDRLPLVLAANRDEFHGRQSRPAQFWSLPHSHPGLLAGKDLTQGGTWLGMTRNGRFAAVTNIRDPRAAKGSRSRGFLTLEFLLGSMSPLDYLASLQDSLAEFGGFNLLVGDRHTLAYLNSASGQARLLSPGIYGLSNAALDADWPKITRGREALQHLLDQSGQIATDSLTDFMLDTGQAPDDQLPDTGIPLELERVLSSPFIRNPLRDYGTRCTTALVISGEGQVRLSEQNYGPDGQVTTRQLFQFALQDASPGQN
jgi:uncharacterized protein with NRDE domain